VSAVLEEQGNPGDLVSVRGILRLFLPIRRARGRAMWACCSTWRHWVERAHPFCAATRVR